MFKIDERLPKESAKDYVVRQLVYNIVHINLTPGQQLDSDEISELLNVSKNPIREAELELSQTRLIEIKPKIGAYVSLIDANIVEEVRELRSVLEAELAALACTTLNKEQINMLWENVVRYYSLIHTSNSYCTFYIMICGILYPAGISFLRHYVSYTSAIKRHFPRAY